MEIFMKIILKEKRYLRMEMFMKVNGEKGRCMVMERLFP